MQPFVVDQRNFNLLIWVVTGKGVIENHDVQSTTITNITVTSTSPMLPLAYLVIKQIVNDIFLVNHFQSYQLSVKMLQHI